MRLTVDTNILVAASISASYPSGEAARQLIDGATAVVVPTIVLCEFIWVMRSRFKRPREEIVASLRAMLAGPTIVVDTPAVDAGLGFLEAGGDFADGVVAHDGRRLGGEAFASFDIRARRVAAAAGYVVVGS